MPLSELDPPAYMSFFICCLDVLLQVQISLSYKQFLTLLLYLIDICAFAASIDEKYDHTELVCKMLKEFDYKIKPKKCHFLKQNIVFLGSMSSANSIFEDPQKVDKVKKWPVPLAQKTYTHFWVKHHTITNLFQSLL